MIGNFKPNVDKHVITNSVCVTGSYKEAMYQYIKYPNSIFKKIEVNGNVYYHVLNDTKNYKMETEAPIYEQIMQLEAIELHKLKLIIESKGGVVLDLSTV